MVVTLAFFYLTNNYIFKMDAVAHAVVNDDIHVGHVIQVLAYLAEIYILTPPPP